MRWPEPRRDEYGDWFIPGEGYLPEQDDDPPERDEAD